MCGLAGFISFAPFADAQEAGEKLKQMTQSIQHRGPDADGHWLDETQGVALGHRRLSILDLSPTGAQPMDSLCGRYVLVYNGEIYNHLALRSQLEEEVPGVNWKGHSDTETLLVAIAEWGLTRALEKAFGMFAFALWDRQSQVLSLGRDRMGEKPLYFAQHEGTWLFGSELQTLRAAGYPVQIARPALAAYLKTGHVPDHLCILEGVQKVMPGSVVELRAASEPVQHCFASNKAQFSQKPTFSDADKAVEALDHALSEVVSDQMLSDVPLGCFLSGGIDSSLVASLMQAQSDQKVRTFSIGFEDERYNEAPHAAAVAEHLGTEHTEFVVTEEDALGLVTDLANIYDEPFADSSQIPTTLLCRLARKHVTVALTGDGGDEVFGGYNRHIRGPKLWQKISRMPRTLRHMGAATVSGAAQLGLRNERVSWFATSVLGLPLTTLENLPKLATTLRSADSAEDFYQNFVTMGHSLDNTLMGDMPAIPTNPRALERSELDLQMADWMMARDTTGYLPGDILVKVDRAAMSTSLETRAPFLDARVANVARQIPIAMHVDDKIGKKLLRNLLYRHVPQSLIERPKQGFAVPLDAWLRGALRSWGADLIADKPLISRLGLNAQAIETWWQAHQDRKVNAGKEIWALLMLLLWAREMRLTA